MLTWPSEALDKKPRLSSRDVAADLAKWFLCI